MKKNIIFACMIICGLFTLTGCNADSNKDKNDGDTSILNEEKPEQSVASESSNKTYGIYEEEIYGFELLDVTIDKLIDINSNDNTYYDLRINDTKIELANTFSAVIFKKDDHYGLFIDVDYLNERIGNGECISVNYNTRQCVIRRRALENARILRCGSKTYVSLKTLETTFNIKSYDGQENSYLFGVEIDSHSPGVINLDGKMYYAKGTTETTPSFDPDFIYSDGRGIWYDHSIHDNGDNYKIWVELDSGLIQIYEMK